MTRMSIVKRAGGTAGKRRAAAPAPAAPADHRTRTGEARRARTHTRILEAAVGVFAAKGPDAPVIADFISAAGVARGTFYNYYSSVAELLQATTRWLEEDLMRSIEGEIAAFDDPVDRLMLGVRLWLHKAASDRVWCAFVARAVKHGDLVESTVRTDLRNGLARGGFAFGDVGAARDLLVGTLHEAMLRMATGRVPRGFPDDVARLVFRALGVPSRKAEAGLARPLPALRRPARRVA